MTLQTLHRMADRVVATDQTETVLLFHLDSGEYFTLDGVAALVWRSITSGGSPADAATAVVGAYEIDRATATEDVAALLQDLVAARLLEPGPPDDRR